MHELKTDASAGKAVRPMGNLTYTTALVVIPPAEVWLPIQALRAKYDAKVRRWMSHITLVYP